MAPRPLAPPPLLLLPLLLLALCRLPGAPARRLLQEETKSKVSHPLAAAGVEHDHEQPRPILFVHLPKTAGWSLTNALFEYAQAHNASGWAPCETTFDSEAPTPRLVPYNCISLPPWRRRLAQRRVATAFGGECNLLASHWDHSIVDLLPPAVRARTTLVTVLRHPVDRVLRWVGGRW